MWTRLFFAVPTVLVAFVLAFAPVFAQDVADPNDSVRATPNAADDRDDPELGWLGLIGLVGLAGLMRRDRDRDHRAEHVDRTTHR